ncbi:MAG TPA: sigma factor-like helix-turn-helix DNA-binding protein [Nocardioidaceae bacterium]|nr:sigma factor-like helix-turn-helix DNA-binding protein [Nocardioidaceae bacterium]
MSASPGSRSDFDEFVAVCSARLLRTAYLLTGDQGEAEDLVERALTRAWAEWHRLDVPPEPHVRRLLVAGWARRWRVPAVRRRRAVVVLRYGEGLSEEETADLLDVTVAGVRRHAARALAAAGLSEDELRRSLEREAGSQGPLSGASLRARLDRRASSSRRRRVASTAAATALAAGAVLAAVQSGYGRSGTSETGPQLERPPAREEPEPPPLLAGYQLDPVLRVNEVDYEYVRSVESDPGQRRLRLSIPASRQPHAVAWVSPVALDGEVVVRVDGDVVRRDEAGSFQSGLLLSTRRPHVVELRATASDVSMRLGLALYRWPQT